MTNKNSIWMTFKQLFQNSASQNGQQLPTVYRPPSKTLKNVCVCVCVFFPETSQRSLRTSLARSSETLQSASSCILCHEWRKHQKKGRVPGVILWEALRIMFFRAVKWLVTQNWMGKDGHPPKSMILKQATTNLGKSEMEKDAEFSVWS